MRNRSESSIWRWVVALVIVVGLFGPAAVSASSDEDPNKSGTDESISIFDSPYDNNWRYTPYCCD